MRVRVSYTALQTREAGHARRQHSLLAFGTFKQSHGKCFGSLSLLGCFCSVGFSAQECSLLFKFDTWDFILTDMSFSLFVLKPVLSSVCPELLLQHFIFFHSSFPPCLFSRIQEFQTLFPSTTTMVLNSPTTTRG